MLIDSFDMSQKFFFRQNVLHVITNSTTRNTIPHNIPLTIIQPINTVVGETTNEIAKGLTAVMTWGYKK